MGVETFAQLLLLLLLVGVVLAYMRGGAPAAGNFVRVKVIGA